MMTNESNSSPFRDIPGSVNKSLNKKQRTTEQDDFQLNELDRENSLRSEPQEKKTDNLFFFNSNISAVLNVSENECDNV